ncbi:acyl-CoA desaturase [Methylobacterium sp. A54F]
MLQHSSTERMIADAETSGLDGLVEWAPAKSLWVGGMTLSAIVLGPWFVSPGAVLLFLVTTAVTLCAGHSLGMHRLLVHRSFEARRGLEYGLVYLGTLVGMAGPLGMVRLHDMRDWAQRQPACHDLHANRLPLLRDAWMQMHMRLVLARPPRFVPEPRLAEDRFYRWLEATWMAQQIPWALLFYAVGGLPWLVWGVPVRIAVSLTGHWLVVHLTHRDGPQGWIVEGEAVQGHDLPAAALITFGEAWHATHHAWPQSARLGIEPGQSDLGWRLLLAFRRLGWASGLKQPPDLVPRPGVRRLTTPAPGIGPDQASGDPSVPLSGFAGSQP